MPVTIKFRLEKVSADIFEKWKCGHADGIFLTSKSDFLLRFRRISHEAMYSNIKNDLIEFFYAAP